MRTRKQRAGSNRSHEISSLPSLESLENRLLMSGTVALTVASGTLTIAGDTADNSIVLEDTGVGTVNITGADDTSVTLLGTTYGPGEVAGVALAYGLTINFGQGGNDTVSAANSLVLSGPDGVRHPFIYTGGAGNDSLFRATGASGMLAVLDPIIGDEEQTLTASGTPAEGDFTISFNGHSTEPIAFGANAAAIEDALQLVEGMETVTVT
ncbi:MAG: LEPR-XLL domain-containing protein, partial [Planctomycetota bacterium]